MISGQSNTIEHEFSSKSLPQLNRKCKSTPKKELLDFLLSLSDPVPISSKFPFLHNSIKSRLPLCMPKIYSLGGFVVQKKILFVLQMNRNLFPLEQLQNFFKGYSDYFLEHFGYCERSFNNLRMKLLPTTEGKEPNFRPCDGGQLCWMQETLHICSISFQIRPPVPKCSIKPLISQSKELSALISDTKNIPSDPILGRIKIKLPSHNGSQSSTKEKSSTASSLGKRETLHTVDFPSKKPHLGDSVTTEGISEPSLLQSPMELGLFIPYSLPPTSDGIEPTNKSQTTEEPSPVSPELVLSDSDREFLESMKLKLSENQTDLNESNFSMLVEIIVKYPSVGKICTLLDASNLSDSVLKDLSEHVLSCELLSYYQCVEFVQFCLFPVVQKLNLAASRILLSTLIKAANDQPKPVVNGLILELLNSKRNSAQLNNAHAEIIQRIIKDSSLGERQVQDFLQSFLAPDFPHDWNEISLALVNHMLTLPLVWGDSELLMLLERLKQVPENVCSSVKFFVVLQTLMTKHSQKILPHKDLLRILISNCPPSKKKTLETKFNKTFNN